MHGTQRMLTVNCSYCKGKGCRNGKDCFNLTAESKAAYRNGCNERLLKAASEVEVEGYRKQTRIEEIIHFSKKMEFTHIGIAFCIGMSKEAEMLTNILSRHFKVSSVCCKTCGIPKSDFDFPSLSGNGSEAACNPAGQALALEKAGTHLNLIMGLCLGHDIIFTRQSHAPVTTIAVKDRVLAHNPMGALYTNYYFKEEKENIK